jgi:23S rRNA pseudouridine2605 synthase
MLGHPVHRLIRARIGPVHLGDLKPGEWRHLTKQELEELEKIKRRKKLADERRR